MLELFDFQEKTALLMKMAEFYEEDEPMMAIYQQFIGKIYQKLLNKH